MIAGKTLLTCNIIFSPNDYKKNDKMIEPALILDVKK